MDIVQFKHMRSCYRFDFICCVQEITPEVSMLVLACPVF